MTGFELALAAERLVGCPFRLHGRDPATGLDCIGVLSAALAAVGRPPCFPTGYSMRTSRHARLPTIAREHGFVPAAGDALAGDVHFTRPGPGQLHLQIVAADGVSLIEAHAGIGRVVRSPGPSRDSLVLSWRLGARREQSIWQL